MFHNTALLTRSVPCQRDKNLLTSLGPVDPELSKRFNYFSGTARGLGEGRKSFQGGDVQKWICFVVNKQTSFSKCTRKNVSF